MQNARSLCLCWSLWLGLRSVCLHLPAQFGKKCATIKICQNDSSWCSFKMPRKWASPQALQSPAEHHHLCIFNARVISRTLLWRPSPTSLGTLCSPRAVHPLGYKQWRLGIVVCCNIFHWSSSAFLSYDPARRMSMFEELHNSISWPDQWGSSLATQKPLRLLPSQRF